MNKKLIKEDITNMKYLFGYKAGKVISEQEHPELGESNPFRRNNGLDEYDFPEELNDRLNNIYDLLDEAMEDPDNDPSDYEDIYDFASVVISQVLNRLRDELGEDFEEYEDDVDDYLRNNEDEYIFDYYNSNSDFEDDEDDDEDDDGTWVFRPYEDNDRRDEMTEQEEPETDRYMFFSNLEQIHRQMGILLEKDPEMISEILDNGHDWAQDHISTAKESIDQVFDFIMNEENGDDEENFEMIMNEDLEFEEETMESILEKHNLLDNTHLVRGNMVMFRTQSSEVIQSFLHILPLLTDLQLLTIENCESADFSDVDICGLPKLSFINLTGTENNFDEQGFECSDKQEEGFYFIND
jgi:hypothetical protein